MAEIIQDSDDQYPEGAEEGWFQVGEGESAYRVKAKDYDINKTINGGHGVEASGPSFDDVSIYWTTNSSGNTTADQKNRTSITWYKLAKAPIWSIYRWELTINCTDTYNFTFYDESGDYYGLNVFQNGGTHYVQYNSDKPNMVSVSGR